MSEKPVTTRDATVENWMRALSESTGSPGGGAGAGVMLAIAASLTSMVAGYSEAGRGEESPLAELLRRSHALRDHALDLADADAEASQAFGAAFALPRGADREDAIRRASVEAARTSAALGERAVDAVDDLAWLAEHGNPALVADVVVACGALRAAVAGARTNVSFDLGSLTSAGESLDEVKNANPALWDSVATFDRALDRIDRLTAALDPRAAPTDDDRRSR
jgi:formiminotetrahydrofolate cyclodeaminase